MRWRGPRVSIAIGWNIKSGGREEYLVSFLFEAVSAALPAEWDVECKYELARVLTTVTSHVRGLPPCHDINVSPSGRLPSSLVRSTVSLVTAGTPAAVMARAMTSLMAWCLAILLRACLHTESWIPCASTSAPHLQVWATQTLQPNNNTNKQAPCKTTRYQAINDVTGRAITHKRSRRPLNQGACRPYQTRRQAAWRSAGLTLIVYHGKAANPWRGM